MVKEITKKIPGGGEEIIKCEVIDNKYVCAVDGHVMLLPQSKISEFQSNPSFSTSHLLASDGYEDYYINLLEKRGSKNKIQRIRKAKEKLEPIAEDMAEEQEIEVGGQNIDTMAQIQQLRERVNELEEEEIG